MGENFLHSTGCLRYSILSFCSQGDCVRTTSTAEIQVVKTSRFLQEPASSFCECHSGWYQTFELSVFMPENMNQESLPCFAHEKLLSFIYGFVVIVTLASLLRCAYLLIIMPNKKRRSLFLTAKMTREAFICISGILAISLFASAALYRLHDMKHRGFIIDLKFTTLAATGWMFAKMSQNFSFYRYVKYNTKN